MDTADKVKVALVGGKNCGKSALFNALTGEKAHVGNYPGVTTHLQPANLLSSYRAAFFSNPEGAASVRRFAQPEVEVVDMPGLMSLHPYSPEEQDALDGILHGNFDVLIDIIDANNIELGLYLALQLIELRIPLVIALNMMDEAARNGIYVETEQIAATLGVDVVPISATKVRGVTTLMEATGAAALNPTSREHIDFCSGDLHKAIHSICHIIEQPARNAGLPLRYAAEQLIAHDVGISAALDIQEPEDVHVIGHIIEHLENDQGYDGETVLAMQRYAFVDELCGRCVQRSEVSADQQRSSKIDAVLTHRIWGIPIFIAIMAVVFWLTFVVIGGPLQELLEEAFDTAGGAIGDAMLSAGVSEWLYDLVVNGAWSGVCSVLSFLPIIMVLFFFLSLLEDSGYTTRVAFVMDKLLRKIGLSGRSLAPLIIGFGCNVPALMSTRTLPSERDRRLTIMLIPFMSCSAKLPVYAMITAAFFGPNAGLVMIALYALGILVAILLGFILSRTAFRGDAIMYVMELPNYRIPALRDVVRHMWDNAKEFVKKAFTIIFIGTVIIWFLQNFDLQFNMTDDGSASILAAIGTQISFIFAPIGLDSWQATTGLLAGLAAKEAIVSTLTVLMGGATGTALATALGGIFTPLTAFVFLAFVLLYVPCLATFATTRKELGSLKAAVGIVVMQILIAYVVCFIIYHIGLAVGLG